MNTTTLKRITLTSLTTLGMALAGPAFAGQKGSGDAYFDYAKVVSSRAITRTEVVNHPRRECWQEPVRERRHQGGGAVPVILGGSLGGLLAHQFGDGNARDVLTVAGALLGASVANEVSANRRAARGGYTTHLEEQCHVIDDYEEVTYIDGYNVTYRYKGQTFSKRMDRDPGNKVRIRVNVTPTYGRGHGGHHADDGYDSDDYAYTERRDAERYADVRYQQIRRQRDYRM